MTRDLGRLLRPGSIAVVGGGAWCAAVLRNCEGFDGPVWWVHPTRGDVAAVADLPRAPDAVFVGVNRDATLDVIAALSAMGAGGAICFASGFAEAEAELGDGHAAQARLLEAAGEMPILGPNCYGVLNYLDGAALWPDQHGGVAVERGVAIISQSSNIAINLTMQTRGLPVAYVACLGNQAQVGLAEMAAALSADPRVTAIGFYIEGIDDLAAFEAMARASTVPLIALKVGRSAQAQVAAVSHTASLTGSAAGASALFARLGVGEVRSLPELLQALMVAHCRGRLASNRIASASCSGGEASLIADLAEGRAVVFPPLDETQSEALRAALGPRVALANPLDYHTYIWADRAALVSAYIALLQGDLGMGLLVLDFPRDDRCSDADWMIALDAAAQASQVTGTPMGILASLSDTLPERVAKACLARGLVPLSGMAEALCAIEVASAVRPAAAPLLIPCASAEASRTWSEAASKAALAAFGVAVPHSGVARNPEATEALAGAGKWVLKGLGHAHKSEAGAVRIGLAAGELPKVARAMDAPVGWLVEEMIDGGVAELLVGVLRDPVHGFVLTLGAGGTETELLQDTTCVLVPASGSDIRAALNRLRCAPKLHGFRGRAGADISAIVAAVMAVQDFVTANAAHLWEVEINPLIATPTRAVAADALIRSTKEAPDG